jgi:uncharacterized membrane protein YeaQ/YmgE (transglycosylase-associated protein family)
MTSKTSALAAIALATGFLVSCSTAPTTTTGPDPGGFFVTALLGMGGALVATLLGPRDHGDARARRH